MSYDDDYDDLPVPPYLSSSLTSVSPDRAVRRRSSKACDQCRKSKCKCERSSQGEPCKSCIMLGTPCTFLGPSRKRGPPKGYIDAIEARLHQTEALVGIMLATKDARAQTLLRDIARDPLAREIISRVDNSLYGVRGRKRAAESSGLANKKTSDLSGPVKDKDDGKLDLTSTHPSNEWQDKVVDMLGAGRTDDPAYPPAKTLPVSAKPTLHLATYSSDEGMHSADGRERQRRRLGDEDYNYEYDDPAFASAPVMGLPSPASTAASVPGPATVSRQREEETGREDEEKQLVEAVGELSLNEDEEVRYHGKASGLYLLGDQERVDGRNEGGIWRFPGARVWPPLPSVVESRTDSESESRDAESDVVSASHKDTFPSLARSRNDEKRAGLSDPSPKIPQFGNGLDGDELLPPRNEQERLLELYFLYVHPSFPVVHKKAFWELWRKRGNSEAYPHMKRPRLVAPLLLLAMFALAARYDSPPAASSTSPSSSPEPSPSSTTPLPTDGVSMWAAGEEYFTFAKSLLDTSYASSRSSTCQALLLMGYREIGIGAMALAWTYVGMAIRMAQDLGMHRNAEGWRRPGLGSTRSGGPAANTHRNVEEGRIFGDWELEERRRIWFGCAVMDKYVSAYIGRPLMIFERDFDTEVPELHELEEMEEWKSLGANGQWTSPVPGRIISCFNKCAELSGILSAIIQAIYAVRPFPGPPGTLTSPITHPGSRRAETAKQAEGLEGVLDRWYLQLPEHLRYQTATVATGERDTSSSLPPAHVLTLHMQYWCAVLLLHRPFIRRALNSKNKPSSDDRSESDDLELIRSRKSYELCASAAHYITSIATVYLERYSLNRCSVFLCYYVFTASIMHVITLTAYPDDPQARINLRRCSDALSAMRYIWPSAGRALELLSGAKMNLEMGLRDGVPTITAGNSTSQKTNFNLSRSGQKRKSVLEDDVEQSGAPSVMASSALDSSGEYVPSIRSGIPAQAQHPIPRSHAQAAQRDIGHSDQHRQTHLAPYGVVPENFAIQPPALLTTDYQWTETSSSAAASVISQESNVRGARRQYHRSEEHEFIGPLSTSVLPQQYSTDLVDEQTQRHQQQRHPNSSHHSQTPVQHPHPHPHQQYPHSQEIASHAQGHSQSQYWSDYSTFSQLDTAEAGVYSGLGISVNGVNEIDLALPDHQHPQPLLSHSQHANVATMYMSEPYGLYGEGYR